MGRWSKERHAQEAAKKAEEAAKSAPEAVEQTEPQAEEQPQQRKPRAEKPEEQERPVRADARSQAMEEIIAKRNQERGIEPEEKPEVEKTEPAAQTEPEAAAPAEPQEAKTEPEAPKTVKVKVDGEEYEVSQSEIDEAGGVRAYQTQRAAENRLRKSNEALAEAKRLQAFLIEMATKQAAPQTKEPSEEEFIQSKLEAIRYGTPEEGAAAMREVLSRSKVDPRQITDNATQAAVVHMARAQASQKFSEEFSDVTTNPLLLKLASQIENERLAQLRAEQKNPVMVDWQDFYRRIGNEIRSVVRPSQPATPATNGHPSPASEKEARKASIVNLPTASARAELPKEDKPQTRDEIFQEMMEKRGKRTK